MNRKHVPPPPLKIKDDFRPVCSRSLREGVSSLFCRLFQIVLFCYFLVLIHIIATWRTESVVVNIRDVTPCFVVVPVSLTLSIRGTTKCVSFTKLKFLNTNECIRKGINILFKALKSVFYLKIFYNSFYMKILILNFVNIFFQLDQSSIPHPWTERCSRIFVRKGNWN